VVDEIGKIECLSRRFQDAVRKALDAPAAVLATIARAGGGVHRRGALGGTLTLLESDASEPGRHAGAHSFDARHRDVLRDLTAEGDHGDLVRGDQRAMT
jgi:hypothetical protein